METRAKITSKGQITVPRAVRQALGVKEGDKLIFEHNGDQMIVRPDKQKNGFAKYMGIGNPGSAEGREAVIRAVRELRDTE
jgi:antitoxin PrlF